MLGLGNFYGKFLLKAFKIKAWNTLLALTLIGNVHMYMIIVL